MRGLLLNLRDALETSLLDFIPSTTGKLTVKFPRDDINITYRGTSEEEKARYPADKKHMTWFDVILGKDASVSVEGFGIPYSNPGHPAGKKHMAWVDVILGKDVAISIEGFGIPYSNPVNTAEEPASQTINAIANANEDEPKSSMHPELHSPITENLEEDGVKYSFHWNDLLVVIKRVYNTKDIGEFVRRAPDPPQLPAGDIAPEIYGSRIVIDSTLSKRLAGEASLLPIRYRRSV
ncbi:hypothetical protein CEK26_004768 [Fusarium fujikuroi]|uniref:Uncharacterized protein n=1 Tax=Fusarium fujikuroi TaxID=5127 RepID=A0A5Q3D384_FUSFU|nr:hypothetical protein CEK27_004769 [Fusarium fujikuroi]QGI91699.1 hypothetical protein CEK26_004768 [Fusarium fujikuroi]SCO36135.1 uncharacterized protein FFNC_05064 [Fusarium fujikuroi]SCO37022.1 uncharacterized protein FFMR_04498 [Fusarium fujikuroi]VTT60853.1 unnamed protein product [Fusarium fujikuroi]